MPNIMRKRRFILPFLMVVSGCFISCSDSLSSYVPKESNEEMQEE